MLDIIDTYSATIIINLLKMINLIGPNPVLVGLKPEIVSYLTQSNFDFGNVLIAKHLDQGIEYLNSIKDKK